MASKNKYLPLGWHSISSLPRGLRNNNPLNIRYSEKNNWFGQVGYDRKKGGFCVFDSPVWGYRAAFKLLFKYQMKYGCKNVAKLIERWAPPSENNTNKYIEFVCEYMKCESSFIPHFGSVHDLCPCCKMVEAMAVIENGGKDHIDIDHIEEAYRLLFGLPRDVEVADYLDILPPPKNFDEA